MNSSSSGNYDEVKQRKKKQRRKAKGVLKNDPE